MDSLETLEKELQTSNASLHNLKDLKQKEKKGLETKLFAYFNYILGLCSDRISP